MKTGQHLNRFFYFTFYKRNHTCILFFIPLISFYEFKYCIIYIIVPFEKIRFHSSIRKMLGTLFNNENMN